MAGSFSEKNGANDQRFNHDSSRQSASSEGKEMEHGDSSDEQKAFSTLDSKVVIPAADKQEDDLYAHLSTAEAEILRRQVDTAVTKAGIKNLYRYATRNDLIIIAISFVCAVAAGAALPLMTIIFGQLTGDFQGFYAQTTVGDDFTKTLDQRVLYLVYIAIGEFITVYISTVGFIYTGEHISGRIRSEYLAACLRQNIGFFDKLGSGEITTRITADTNLVQEGISEKVALTLNSLATFFTAFVIGFIKSYKFTFILSSTVFAIATIMGLGGFFVVKFTKDSLHCYAQGGTVAEEVISSIRNAVAFGTQDKLARQYDVHLIAAERRGFKTKFSLGLMTAGMYFVLYLNYGLAFWMGSRFLVDGEIQLSSILTILMAIMMGAFSLGNVLPNVQAFATGLSASAKIFNTIDRISPIDPSADDGLKLEHVEGVVELKNVKHIYPSRPEVTVMDGVNLVIPAGKMTALVGASGSGKSTIIGLVERFYDPVGGEVFLDGHLVKDLNLRWLRQHISLVSQEPTLFGTTVFHNIRFGLMGTEHENASMERQRELVVEAAKMANAHDFISALPDAYETNVGERGFLLSGGQKQRIAIARAVVSNPKILLLDEATSALDTKSEGVVQAALEVAAAGRTTIQIAHRLSTIKDAHNIVVMAEGRIIEQGTHDELLTAQGAYFKLVEAQKIAETKEMTSEEEESVDAKDDELIKELSRRASNKSSPLEDPDDNLIRSSTGVSQSSVALRQKHELESKQYSLWTLMKLIGSFNKPETALMLIGLIFSILCGAGNPTQAVFFAKEVMTLSTPTLSNGQPIPGVFHHIRHTVDFWSLMYLMLAFVMLLTFSTQGIAFAYCSEKLVHRVRDQAFRTILRQDIEFFDREENTAGALTSFLSTETTHMTGLSGVTLGTILTVSTTLIIAMVLSLALTWELALVCIATIPILLGCGFFRFWILAQFQQRAQKAYSQSASYACEATNAIRTVASLTREEDVLANYRASLAAQERKSLKSVLKTSTLYAAAQSFMFLCVALGFWFGGQRIANGEYTLFQFFVTFTSVIFGAQSAGTIFAFAPDMGKAKYAAQQLKVLFDRKPTIDTWSQEGEPVAKVSGTIEFRDVHFRYPTRPEQPVLRGLNLSVKPGQYIALVGASGCGKSTTIALLERFYDPLAGGIYIDGREISTLNVNEYRSFLALVSQEPTLYQGTIRENVLLGSDNSETTDEQIVFACKEANIYDFIMSLPEGFSTVVGSKGSLLSGGQKQRIAIARALLRDPKILLLDEATSALDSESEHVVQAALDKAAKGRTTIAVAHRLSTIQKADIIYVFDQGRIVESGDHANLMALGGRYAELVNLQSLSRTQ